MSTQQPFTELVSSSKKLFAGNKIQEILDLLTENQSSLNQIKDFESTFLILKKDWSEIKTKNIRGIEDQKEEKHYSNRLIEFLDSIENYSPDTEKEESSTLQKSETNPDQITPLFISYSREDSGFVDKIGEALEQRGINYWRDTKDMKAGNLEKQLDQALKDHPILLLVFSKDSVNSDWVEIEAVKARELEKRSGRDVFCPVALDNSWQTANWPAMLTYQIKKYYILDFSRWQDETEFQQQFGKLVDGLDLFYKD